MTLTRRTTLATLAALLAAAPLAAHAAAAPVLSAEDQALVDKAIAALMTLNQVKGRFTQTDSRGASSEGTLYLKRPGKARFAYDAPSGLTVVSDGQAVSIADSRLKTFDKYPLSATPLALFLGREIRLDRGVRVTEVNRRTDGFSVTATDIAHKTRGSITLDFAGDPLTLKGWSLLDAQGATTRVRIAGLEPAPALEPALFVLRDPRPKPGARP